MNEQIKKTNRRGIVKKFPIEICNAPLQGLTKREYFAAMALQGVLSNTQGFQDSKNSYAEIALLNADILLKQLEL